MCKYFIIAVSFLIISFNAFSQKMNIGGNVQDTIAKTPLAAAVVMAVRLKDSILISHTRTDATGFFALKIPIDTVQIIVSHSRFGDQSFYVFGSSTNHAFDFGKIILPPKSHSLNEIIIYAYKDPVYYKGDTLIYAADSFKVKPNATVEDLLKKLPGIQVDAQGKITSQGKKVDQVLVDGDEFFGSDPTMATQNLNANAIESVQVYEKKNEEATDDGDETLQVMNLKLKEDAKKGYFGKVSGASDFQEFYEGELLTNKFNNKQKISVFALGSNTPRSSIGWGEMYKYGLTNNDIQMDDDDEYYWLRERGNENVGIPRTLKTGVYYTDKISSKTKLNFNYTYNNQQLTAKTETSSQYFLTDTSYVTDNNSSSNQQNESHVINFGIVQTLDSLTELIIIPKLNFNTSTISRNETTDFIDSEDMVTRRTEIANNNVAKGYDFNTTARIIRKFKKPDRLLVSTYNLTIKNNNAIGTLISDNIYFDNSLIADGSVNQQKNNTGSSKSNNANITYTEPITKKIKLEFAYDFNYNVDLQNKEALNYANGEYTLQDSLFTNNFENKRMINRFGAKYIYEVKKQRFIVGSRLRQVSIVNANLIAQQSIKQNVNNVLPFVKYLYKFSANTRLNFNFYTSSSQPSIEQLQPIQDNTNPNQIKRGNPNLLPTFKQNFVMFFSTYKVITGKYYGSRITYVTTNNAFTNAIEYDSIGRTITTPVNTNDNYNSSGNVWAGFPFFSKKLQLEPNLNFNYSSYTNFINNQKNNTKTTSVNSGLNINIQLDTLEFRIGYNYNYNSPSSTLSTAGNRPYTSQGMTASLLLKLPLKFILETNAEYIINSERAEGYNINYFLWNASLGKTFLKNENLILSIDATDILNQNINTSRVIRDNVIIDNKTNVISRYILLKAVFKFNSNKTEEDEEDY